MFVFPYGLDDARVSRMPWMSIALLAANVLVFAATCAVVPAHKEQIRDAAGDVVRYAADHPYLKVSPEVERLGLTTAEPEAEIPLGADVASEQAHLDGLTDALLRAYAAHPVRRFGLVPSAGIAQPGWLTYMFLHGGFMHLLGNMLVFFLICAPFLEDVWGRAFFLAFYLAGGLVAALVQVVLDLHSTMPVIGASGAISACLGAFSVRFAARRVRVFYWILFKAGTAFVPAWIWGGIGLAMDLFSLATSGSHAGVAYGAHVGGFLFGAAAAFVISRSGREWKRARSEGDFVLHPSLDKGDLLFGRGDLARARSLYEEALAADPSDGEARLRLVRLEVADGRQAEAAAHLERLAMRDDRELLGRAALDAAERLDPARLRPATALRLAEILGSPQRPAARRLADVAAGAGGAIAGRALALAAELELSARELEGALALAERALATPGASSDTLSRARQVERAAREALSRREQRSHIELSEPVAAASAPVVEAPPPAPATGLTATATATATEPAVVDLATLIVADPPAAAPGSRPAPASASALPPTPTPLPTPTPAPAAAAEAPSGAVLATLLAGAAGGPLPGEAAGRAPRPKRRVVWCRLLGIEDEKLALETTGKRRMRIPLAEVDAVAVGIIEQLGPPVNAGRAVVADLRLRPTADQAPVVLRLPGPWLGLGRLFPGMAAPAAFATFLAHVLARSGAAPRPSRDQVTGPGYARFTDVAAFEATCWAEERIPYLS
jgi:membrane associated rhomboid family serine protease